MSSEMKATLYPHERRPKIVSFVGGLGGRDISVAEFGQMVDRGTKLAEKGEEDRVEMIGVRV